MQSKSGNYTHFECDASKHSITGQCCYYNLVLVVEPHLKHIVNRSVGAFRKVHIADGDIDSSAPHLVEHDHYCRLSRHISPSKMFWSRRFEIGA